MLVCTAAVSVLFSFVAEGLASPVLFVAGFAEVVLVALLISGVLRATDRETIADFRRTTAVLFAGEILWLLSFAAGAGYSRVVGSMAPFGAALIFGGFICSSFEFLVLGGVFTGREFLAATLAVLHPLGALLVLWVAGAPVQLGYVTLATGTVAYITIAAFVPLLMRRRTAFGYNAVTLFQAFMKTWTTHAPTDLESIISAHSEQSEVRTKVLRFESSSESVFIVLPGVHPGPFFPIGSYNLPGLMSAAFKPGHVLTLHRPGGHERNLATNGQARQYTSQVKEFAFRIGTASERAFARGPLRAHIGMANASSTVFSKDLLLTISFAPHGSDDIATDVEGKLEAIASRSGFDASVVDAHNSIDHGLESPETSDEGWARLFEQMKEAPERPLRIGYSNSNEVGFSRGEDLTADGLCVLLFETAEKSALVLADANNAAPSLREVVQKTLASEGYQLLEFCTSDSHDLAARGLTVDRGYRALGEATPVESIAKLVAKLTKLAESRLAPCRYGSGELTSTVQLFGSKAIDEFASVTQSSSRFASTYFRFALASTLVLFLLSIVL